MADPQNQAAPDVKSRVVVGKEITIMWKFVKVTILKPSGRRM